MGDSSFHGKDGQVYKDSATTISPPTPTATQARSQTSRNVEVTRNAPMTGSKAPKDPTTTSGYVPGVK